MRQFGLIGYPLSHSFSCGYFTQKFVKENIQDSKYINFSIESIEMLPEIIKGNSGLTGLNVTIPYKQKVIPYLDEIDQTAMKVNAVNTIKIYTDGYGKRILKGYNTDIYGFNSAIAPYLKSEHRNALILGTGGASKAVFYSLMNLGINCKYASRTHSELVFKTYDQLIPDDLKDFQIIVNTTPLGMFPKTDEFPDIPYEGISGNQILFDLIYNPSETMFLSKGKSYGAIIINGYNMLVAQAEESWKIWNS
jgi:shikimate dehydrogenase